jgi:hypothetical protein
VLVLGLESGVGFVVPKGLDERSLAVYCQGMRLKKIRPVRVRSHLVYWRVHRQIAERSSNPIIPFPNGTVPCFWHPLAVNCQATFIQSLRDKISSSPTSLRTLIRPFALSLI